MIPCSEEGVDRDRHRYRPRLYYSVSMNGVDHPITLGHHERIEDAADRFLSQHNLQQQEAARAFIVDEMKAHLTSRRESREALRTHIAFLRQQGAPIKIVIGASVPEVTGSEDVFGPWVPFTVNDLDILSRDDFRFYFQQPQSVDAILAEHVLEHLPAGDVLQALRLCREFLKVPEGYMRIAVPDWFSYSGDMTRKMAVADMQQGHYTQLNIHSITYLLEKASFHVIPREHSTKENIAVVTHFNPLDGLIRRSTCFSDSPYPPSVIVDACTASTPSLHQSSRVPPCDVDAVLRESLRLREKGAVVDAEWAQRVARDMAATIARKKENSIVIDDQAQLSLESE